MTEFRDFKNRVHARRAKVTAPSAPTAGTEGRGDTSHGREKGRLLYDVVAIAWERLGQFIEEHDDIIRPKIDRLSRLSGLGEEEMRKMFGQMLRDYTILIFLARRNEPAVGRNFERANRVLEEISRDLSLLLFDFGVVIKRVSASTKDTGVKFDKELAKRIIKRFDPHVLDRLRRDPALKSFTSSQIRNSMYSAAGGEEFFHDLIPRLEKMYDDPAITREFSQSSNQAGYGGKQERRATLALSCEAYTARQRNTGSSWDIGRGIKNKIAAPHLQDDPTATPPRRH